MPTLESVLREAQLSQYLANFNEVGISSPVDLIHLTVDDFGIVGISDPSEKKRLGQLIQAIKASESPAGFSQQPKPRSLSQSNSTAHHKSSSSTHSNSSQLPSSQRPTTSNSNTPQPSNLRSPIKQPQTAKASPSKGSSLTRPSSDTTHSTTIEIIKTPKLNNPLSQNTRPVGNNTTSATQPLTKDIQEFLDLSNNLVKIRVAVRKRPLSSKEVKLKQVDAMDMPSNQELIVTEQKVKVDLTKYTEKYEFSFDECIGAEATKEEVYSRTIRPLLSAVFKKARTTCFAYGQTGSGKTFTMAPMPLLAAQDVLKVLSLKDFRHLKAYVSVFEIYLSMVFDLMNNRKKLLIREDSVGTIHIVGLEQIEMTNVNILSQVLENAEKVRSSAPTHANANSSRSHQVLQIILKEGDNVFGKMSFIDLAGSEWGADIKDTNRQTRMEGAEINKSLLALKECIRALDRDSNHIPFRGSKLTEVLKDSFIGNSFTMMMACVSPASGSVEHSLNTLRYADRVKELRQTKDKNAPFVDVLTPGSLPNQRQAANPRPTSTTNNNNNNNEEIIVTNYDDDNDNNNNNNGQEYYEQEDQITQQKRQIQQQLQNQLQQQIQIQQQQHLKSPQTTPMMFTKDSRRSASFVVRNENEIDLVRETTEDENLRMHDELIDTILLEEEQLFSDHRTEIEQTMRLVKEEMRLLDMMDNPGAQVDDYVAQLDVVLQSKIKIMNDLRDKLKIFQEHLQEEDQMSKAFVQQSYSRHY